MKKPKKEIPLLKRVYRKIKTRYYRLKEYRGKNIFSGEIGNALIKSKLSSEEPFLISRIGATELEVLECYLKNKDNYSEYIKEKMFKHAGIFPPEDSMIKQFSEIFLESIFNSDIIGVWFNRSEGKIINNYNQSCDLVELKAIEPYYWDNPWSNMLSGKKVLVIHPFKESIEQQYHNHKKIFNNSEVLPTFELKIIKSVQSMKGNELEHKNWVEALQYMKNQIDMEEFDIAIIGAGAYGLPLGSYIKSKGKQAIHLGGATQILFGIKGKRWDNHPFISQLYNKNWVRPLETEIFKGARNVENGCYW